MTPDRCPACNAAVTASAQWCTLCYASLRVPETVPQTVPAEAAPVPVAPPYSAPLPPDPILDAPNLDAPVFQAPPVVGTEAKGWPCLGCGAMVPIEDNACSQCGRPFLPSDDGPSLALPGIGDLSRMDRGQRLVVALAAAGLVTGLIVLLMFVGGSVL